MRSAPDRIGVVGATGFVGRHLVADLVAEGPGRPRLFGRSGGTVAGCPVEPLDLRPQTFAGLDCLVHLAGITTSRASPEALQRTNVDLAVDVARAAAAAGVKRFVFLSSLHVHGKAADGAVGPDSPLRADNAYGGSKIAAEQALAAVAAETGLELAVLRPPMVYGPGAKGSFSLLARLVRTGAPLPLALARGRRSFCSVNNLVSAIRHAIDAPIPGGPLIPADSEDFETRELVEAMAGAVGRRSRLWPVPRAVLAAPLALVGRREMITSLFEPLRIDRSHWAAHGWSPVETGAEAVRAALAPPTADGGLVLYITNSTPYFFSHRIALASEAAARGFRIGLAGGDVEQHRARIEAEGIVPLLIPGGARGVDPLGDLRAARAIAGHVRRLDAAVIHASGLKTIFLCALTGLATRLPRVVCIVTGLGATYINSDLRTRILRRGIETVIGPLLRRADTAVVFQNADDRAYFLEQGLARPETSLIIKGSGVDTAEYAFSPEPATEVPLVVFPARLLKSKGVLEFARAAAIVRSRGVAARFALVGDLDPANPDALSADELARLVAEGHVEAWGFRGDMAAVFAGCNLVCLPSYREGSPKALIEAASAGRAIVTTDVPGCREIVADGRNGLLVPVRDADALADALAVLLRDPDRRRAMGRAGRALVEAEFSLDVVIARTADLYGDPTAAIQARPALSPPTP